MPPRPPNSGKKPKVVEDKTFGLKNKNKSAKVGKYVQQLQKQAEQGKKNAPNSQKNKARTEDVIYKPVVIQKNPPGVDPKQVLCAYFVAGVCTKDKKCKYSHNLNLKNQKNPSPQAQEPNKEEEQQENLEEEIKIKESTERKKSRIVCKYFLEALEGKKYGWFWVCPNGGENCNYLHEIPPSFSFGCQEEENDTPIEEIIEKELAELPSEGLTPITEEVMKNWRSEWEILRKESNIEKDKEKAYGASLKSSGKFTGRDIFTYDKDIREKDGELCN